MPQNAVFVKKNKAERSEGSEVMFEFCVKQEEQPVSKPEVFVCLFVCLTHHNAATK